MNLMFNDISLHVQLQHLRNSFGSLVISYILCNVFIFMCQLYGVKFSILSLCLLNGVGAARLVFVALGTS